MSDALLIDLTGRVIRDWQVLKRLPNDSKGRTKYLCQHADGRVRERTGATLLTENDPVKYMMRLYRTRISIAFRKASSRKNTLTSSLLGCSGKELVEYISSKLEDGMSLSNYGQWHLDHIIPIASFDITIPEQAKRCFHYTNLQPLWAEHNLSKHDRLDWIHPAKQASNIGAHYEHSSV